VQLPSLSCSISTRLGKAGDFRGRPYRHRNGGDPLRCGFDLRLPVSSRASLETKLIPSTQLPSCAEQRPGRPQLSSPTGCCGLAVPDLAAGHRRDDICQPATMVQWHRKGLPPALALAITPSGTTQDRQEIPCFDRLMSRANRCGERPAITGMLKLGIKIAKPRSEDGCRGRPRVPSRLGGASAQPPADLAGCMFVVATAHVPAALYLDVLSHDHTGCSLRSHPNPRSLAFRPKYAAFSWDTTPRYLLRDRDKSYGRHSVSRVRAMGIRSHTAPRSPWQNPLSALIGSIRRECLDHVIISASGTYAASCPIYFSIFIMEARSIFRSTRIAHGLVLNLPSAGHNINRLPESVPASSAMSVEPREIWQGDNISIITIVLNHF